MGVVAIAGVFIANVSQAAEREVRIDGGKAPLFGTLSAPEGTKPGPAVLFISGSGPTDRNGDSTVPGVKPATQRLLAQGLAAEGIASLRFDKRAIGASAAAAPAEIDLRFVTLVDDAVAWAKFLGGQSGVSCVIIAGHSEGALIAAMAAQKTPTCGVIEIAGAGRSADVVMGEQLTARAPEPLRSQALAALAELKAGHPVADPGLPALFRPSVQPYLMSFLPIDPAAELAKVKAPVLILQGENDLQVSVVDAKTLAAARPDAKLVLLPGVNHVLKDAPADPQGNFATYADPSLPLDAKVLPAIVAFVTAAKH